MATLLRKKANSKGSRTPRRRIGPYARLSAVWPVIFASTLLDPLIPYIVRPTVPYSTAITIATTLSIALLPFLNQARTHKLLAKLRHFNRRSLEQQSKIGSALLLLAVSAGLLPKLFVAASFNATIFLAVVLIFCISVGVSFRKALKAQRDEKQAVTETPWLQIQRWESQLIALNLIPMFMARSISLCGACVAAPPDDYATRLPFVLIGALFLAMLKPERRLFIGQCKRCRIAVPIVIAGYGSCLRCNQDLHSSYVRVMESTPPSPARRPHPAERAAPRT